LSEVNGFVVVLPPRWDVRFRDAVVLIRTVRWMGSCRGCKSSASGNMATTSCRASPGRRIDGWSRSGWRGNAHRGDGARWPADARDARWQDAYVKLWGV